ncbi:hypothetical protein Pcinc_001627 [Petrolisthes cinctipes]|uniref:rRNA adenine N(6)-methyltransferase n=1 Tax=Petrolisthes cinctipes TaxID=88211 RepID=A0AAE1GN07_PETCI|nr:hypothetical protein Pcinc_001627 [Petrolisthes cinctipes]
MVSDVMAFQSPRLTKLLLRPVYGILRRDCVSGSLKSDNPRNEKKNIDECHPRKQRTRKISLLQDMIYASQENAHSDFVLKKSQQEDLSTKNNYEYNKEERQIIKANTKKLKLLLKGIKKGRYQYLVDRDAAKTLSDHLKDDLEQNDVIVEISPGLGLLTEVLLACTNQPVSVYAYEPCDVLRSHLATKLLPLHSESLHLSGYDIQKFYSYYIIDKRVLESEYLNEILGPLPAKGDREVSPVKIVGIIYDLKFFSRLTLSFTLQCCFFKEIYPVFYLYVPHKVYCCLDRHYRYYRNRYLVGRHLFWYYFTMEELDTAPRAGFSPSPPLQCGKHEATEDLHLVKISHNPDIFNKVNLSELENFHFFIRTVLPIKRDDTLVLRLERWIPDCGPELIKNGIHPFAHPRDLDSDQLFLAYKIFTSNPAFHQSVFHIQRKQYVARYGEKGQEETLTLKH